MSGASFLRDLYGGGGTSFAGLAAAPFPSKKEIEDWDPGEPWRNNTGSVPRLSFQLGFWQVSSVIPSFVDPLTANVAIYGDTTDVVARAVWIPPVFDLRPDLLGSTNGQPTAQPIYRVNAGAVLTMQVSGLQSIVTDMNVYMITLAHVNDPQRLVQVGGRQDISADFWDGNGTVMNGGGSSYVATVAPPDGPPRYWQQVMVFDAMSGTLPTAQAAQLLCDGLFA